jgi:regulatory associated protein of mTOR
MATGSINQYVKVSNFAGENLSTIYYHGGFLSQRIGPVSALNFHTYHPWLAAGATDSIVSLYSSESLQKKIKK